MFTNDPISDMLTRIRNAAAARKADVLIPFSKVKVGIAQILKEEGYVNNFSIVKGGQEEADSKFDQLKVDLKYAEGDSFIKNLKRISKPGRKVYVTKDNLPTVLNKLGVAIVSTSQGLMTNKKARKLGIGGEVICEIY